MWLRHWKLDRDPFPSTGGAYVSTAPHDEAVARLVHAIRAGERLAILRAGSGIGKSVVIGRALREARCVRLRVATAVAPPDGVSLYDQLARSLGCRSIGDRTKAESWRAIVDASRLIAAQRGRLILIVDDFHLLEARADFDRLTHLDPRADVTLIGAARPEEGVDDLDAFPIALAPLTRSEAGAYLVSKLRSAGRAESIFEPRTLARVHAATGGVPRRLDRLTGMALREAAIRRLDAIPADLVEAIDRESGPRVLRLGYDRFEANRSA